eukprot:355064-Prymnesium_polylepis.2
MPLAATAVRASREESPELLPRLPSGAVHLVPTVALKNLLRRGGTCGGRFRGRDVLCRLDPPQHGPHLRKPVLATQPPPGEQLTDGIAQFTVARFAGAELLRRGLC